MKPLLFISVSALVIAGANAQVPALTDEEATVQWLKLETMTSGESDQERLAHLKSHGLSDDGARALVMYIQRSDAELAAVMASFQHHLCDQQEELRNGGQEAFAQFVEREAAEQAAARRKIVEGAAKVLSPSEGGHFKQMLADPEHGPKVALEPDEVVPRIREGKITVEGAVKRMCNKSGEQTE